VTAVAAKAPGRVTELTLVAPAGFGSAINADHLRGFATATSRRELKPHLTALFASPDLVTRRLADDLLKYKRLDGAAPAIDAAPLLSTVDVPVRVVGGRADAVLPPENGAALPGVRYVDGAGHLVHLEAPGAVVAAITA
jgi:pyruvate dehydrogenase E2 component (dihydrolipoamide acetyltransferase)